MLAKTKYYKYLILKNPDYISHLDPGSLDIVITHEDTEFSKSFKINLLYYRLIDKETRLLIKKVNFGSYRKIDQNKRIEILL